MVAPRLTETDMTHATTTAPAAPAPAYPILLAVALCHMANDTLQSLLAAIYPVLKEEFTLAYWQVGLLTAAFMVTASVLQPVVGFLTDRRPMPWSLPFAPGFTLLGVLLLAFAPSYPLLLAGSVCIGLGSSVFHPEAIRVTRAASGGRYGLGQSVFNIGGNLGTSAGPLAAAFLVVPLGRSVVAVFAVLALGSMAILRWVSRWHLTSAPKRPPQDRSLTRRQIGFAIAVLLMLLFSRYIYVESLNSFYTFYLIERFGVGTQSAQLMLFLFLAALALGIFLGGPLGDRIGARRVIFLSILGPLPLTLILPYVGLTATAVLTVAIGLVIASSFPAIMVYSQALIPGRIGLIAGLFYGFAFGIAGIGAAVLGALADVWGLEAVYRVCSVLPALGVLAFLLPRDAP